MAWLTALLAFATTMLVFSTIVATFVELIHRLLKMRRKGLGIMLEAIALHDKDRGLVSSRNYPLPVATYRTALVAKNAANSAANARKTKEANRGNVGGSEENGLE